MVLTGLRLFVAPLYGSKWLIWGLEWTCKRAVSAVVLTPPGPGDERHGEGREVVQ